MFGVDRKELSIVDEDIAKVFYAEMDRGYPDGLPTQMQIARSLKEISILLRRILEEHCVNGQGGSDTGGSR